jgi:excisionase family DNA binding protein
MTGPFLTAREVANKLGFCTETILRWQRDGELPAIRTHTGRIRFSEAEIETWLKQRATPRRGVLATPAGVAQQLGYPVLATPDDEEE